MPPPLLPVPIISILSLLLATSITIASTQQRSCYSRNGTLITNPSYRACSNDTTHDSPCCGTNHQGAGETNVADDICEANGLCQNWAADDGTGDPPMLWWRQGCTDPTWESEWCLGSVCNFGLWQNDNAPVQKCGDNQWCCGDANCCDISSSVFALAATVGPTPTPSSESSTPASASAAATSSSSEPAAPANNDLSTGAKVGIGVGVSVGAIVLGGLIGLLVWRLRQRKGAPVQNYEYAQDDKREATVYGYSAGAAAALQSPAELHGEGVAAELGERPRAELGGSEDGDRQENRK